MRRFLLLLVIAWLVPVAAGLVIVQNQDDESEALWAVSDSERFSPIGERTEDGVQGASLRLTWSGRADIAGTQRAGVVTEILAEPGQPLRDGQPLLRIDQRAIYVQVGGSPLYRDLRQGDRGPDVADLAQFLSSTLGRRVAPVAGQLGEDMVAAISAFYARDGVTGKTVFAVSDLGYVPEGAAVDTFQVRVGQRLNGGEPLASVQARLDEVQVVLDGPPERQALLRDAEVALTFPSGTELALGSIDVPPTEYRKLARLLTGAPESVESLIIKRVTPMRFGAVPSSAVVSTERGDCIYIRARSQGAVESRMLDDEASAASLEIGITYVPPELIGETVLANPSAASSLPPCV